MPVFQSVQDEDLVRSIESAASRVVFFAPGVSEVVSKALITCMQDGTVGQVMMVLDGTEVTVGTPLVEGASLKARIEQHGRAPKLRFMKYKNKVRYRRILGHHQHVTRLVVDSISRG